ncbi:radical SAM protein [Chlorobium limicola]|uniref:radical SAM protein n=1 Tax=Chlorobium limicola TaxID=1092 RepID=UPI0009EAC3DC|nr:radical SAM protein [Chlorobium limicola]
MPLDRKREQGPLKHVFGPVSSKRLGQSLGVDLLPMKSCTWNCVYCQIGRTKHYVTERCEFYPPEEILKDIRDALQAGTHIDWITFVGSGETLLYKGIGYLIEEVKKMTAIPVAVITNGSLFHFSEVRSELLLADAVLPSLNAGSEELYERIDRPAPGFTFKQHLDGLIQFRREYKGKLWVEVMLLNGLNDSDEALNELAAAMKQVAPDMVHLVLPTRPAPEQQVVLPDNERIDRAVAILSTTAPVLHPAKGNMDLSNATDLLEAVTAIVFRHPVQETELMAAMLAVFYGNKEQTERTMQELFGSGRFSTIEQAGEAYWIMRS